MTELDLLTKFGVWYLEQCNGIWEHNASASIQILDNPGWIVRVTLRGTRFQDAVFEPIKIDKGENDWLECSAKEAIFTGAGDLSKISTILEVFLKFVGKV